MKALKKGMSAAELVEQAVDAALDDLKSFHHQTIIKALKASPNGFRASEFCGIQSKGVKLAEPREVAVAMQERNESCITCLPENIDLQPQHTGLQLRCWLKLFFTFPASAIIPVELQNDFHHTINVYTKMEHPAAFHFDSFCVPFWYI